MIYYEGLSQADRIFNILIEENELLKVQLENKDEQIKFLEGLIQKYENKN